VRKVYFDESPTNWVSMIFALFDIRRGTSTQLNTPNITETMKLAIGRKKGTTTWSNNYQLNYPE
jgi:hypothetical protein